MKTKDNHFILDPWNRQIKTTAHLLTLFKHMGVTTEKITNEQ